MPSRRKDFVLDGQRVPYATLAQLRTILADTTPDRPFRALIIAHPNRVSVIVSNRSNWSNYIHPDDLQQIISDCLTAAGVRHDTTRLRGLAHKARQLGGSVLIRKAPGKSATVQADPRSDDLPRAVRL